MGDGWYGEWTDWRDDSEQQARLPLRLSRGVVTGDVASQVNRARHPPEPSTASCLHASFDEPSGSSLHLVEGALCATMAPSERERPNVFFVTLSMSVLLILVPPFTYS